MKWGVRLGQKPRVLQDFGLLERKCGDIKHFCLVFHGDLASGTLDCGGGVLFSNINFTSTLIHFLRWDFSYPCLQRDYILPSRVGSIAHHGREDYSY